MVRQNRLLGGLFLLVLAVWPSPWAQAQSAPVSESTVGQTQVFRIHRPESLSQTTLAHPMRLSAALPSISTPLWAGPELWASTPKGLWGLEKVEKPGLPQYDPSSQAWYASANGTLVRLEPSGKLPVVADGIQGRDVDVRALASIAVSREPNDTIVLHRFGPSGTTHQVLLRGAQFFRPRFSPDGSQVLVAESRAQGGHFWTVSLDGQATDRGQGYGASWHPDGRTIVFTRVTHDGYRVTASDLWALDMVRGQERCLGQTPRAELEPAVSPDGKLIAFLDAATRQLFVASWEQLAGARR